MRAALGSENRSRQLQVQATRSDSDKELFASLPRLWDDAILSILLTILVAPSNWDACIHTYTFRSMISGGGSSHSPSHSNITNRMLDDDLRELTSSKPLPLAEEGKSKRERSQTNLHRPHQEPVFVGAYDGYGFPNDPNIVSLPMVGYTLRDHFQSRVQTAKRQRD